MTTVKDPISKFFESFGFKPIKKEDTFSIEMILGYLLIEVTRKKSGGAEALRVYVGESFKNTKVFNIKNLTITERDDLVKEFVSAGYTKAKTAKHLGLTQATVMNICRK